MRFIVKTLLTALLILLLATQFSGVQLTGYGAAVGVALVLAVLNTVVRPVLVVLTIPVTILSLGLFLLVINALMLWFAAALLSSFGVDSFFTAILFSLVLSIGSWFIDKLLSKD